MRGNQFQFFAVLDTVPEDASFGICLTSPPPTGRTVYAAPVLAKQAEVIMCRGKACTFLRMGRVKHPHRMYGEPP